MQVWNVPRAAHWKYSIQKWRQKNRHLGTIPQLCQATYSQLRHVLTIGKNLLSSNTSSTCPHNMVTLRPTSGWVRFVSLGHPCKFQPVSRLGSVTVRHSGSGRQPNFAALNRGCHLYSSGWPSRWALAHILVCTYLLFPYCFSNLLIPPPCFLISAWAF